MLLVLGCSTSSDSPGTRRHATLESGEQIVAIFMGSSGCGSCTSPAARDAVARSIDSISRYASRHGRRFAAIGIALDWSIPSGIEYLAHIGTFDEVLVGDNWLNLGAIIYVWDDRGKAALPQLLVVSRTVEVADTLVTVERERILARAVGVEAISHFSTASLPP